MNVLELRARSRRVLHLAPGLLARLQDAARESGSLECCGLLGGRDDGGTRTILAARPCRNVAEQPAWEFRLHPQDQLDAMLAFEEDGLQTLGAYHSHPRGPPHPSPVDEARAAFAGWTYIVLWAHSPNGWGAWRWTGASFVREGVGEAQGD